jgi:hypothetical protein
MGRGRVVRTETVRGPKDYKRWLLERKNSRHPPPALKCLLLALSRPLSTKSRSGARRISWAGNLPLMIIGLSDSREMNR